MEADGKCKKRWGKKKECKKGWEVNVTELHVNCLNYNNQCHHAALSLSHSIVLSLQHTLSEGESYP